jgi:VanZ family protein
MRAQHSQIPASHNPVAQIPAAQNSAFPHFIALTFLFIIVYTSLEPFRGWSVPQHDFLKAFLSGAKAPRWVPFDWLVNVGVYIPLGYGLAGTLKSGGRALFACALISLALELTQSLLPTRHPSAFDWLMNTSGAAIGVWLFALSRQSRWVRSCKERLRRVWMPGVRGDFGMAVLIIFFLAHLNPGLSPFSSTYFLPATGTVEPGLAFLQAAHTGLNVIAVGLFADLLLRTRRDGGVMLLLVLLLAMVSKTLLAAALLRPGLWGLWLAPPVAIGIGLGAIGLLGFFWMPAAQKRVLCNISVIIALLLPALAPDWALANAPVRAFEWNYGHLLNFNELSQTLLRLWPLLVSVYLLTTAGNPFQDGKQ